MRSQSAAREDPSFRLSPPLPPDRPYHRPAAVMADDETDKALLEVVIGTYEQFLIGYQVKGEPVSTGVRHKRVAAVQCKIIILLTCGRAIFFSFVSFSSVSC